MHQFAVNAGDIEKSDATSSQRLVDIGVACIFLRHSRCAYVSANRGGDKTRSSFPQSQKELNDLFLVPIKRET